MRPHSIACSTFLLFSSLMLVRAANETPQEFRDQAKAELKRAKAKVNVYAKAKNVVLMVGDGLGISTVTAARIYRGQQKGMSGEENKLFFEDFPNVGLSKTYNSDFQVADSAGTAVAMMAGLKTRIATLGVDGGVVRVIDDCAQFDKSHDVKTILDYAMEDGRSVGIVTTTRVTHATPAAAYSHAPNRYMENPTDMAKFSNCDHVKDIARQLVEDNPNIQVVLGGGRRNFLNSTTPDHHRGTVSSLQRDGPSLVQAWKDDKAARNQRHAYVENAGQLDDVDPAETDYLMGLFSSSHMTYELSRDKTRAGEPSLTEMTTKAIQILSKNPKGFFLLVEGGRIDHGHHDNLAKHAMQETVEFDNAVRRTVSLTSEKDTLLVVTADHSHVFNIAGYPSRGNDILGLVDVVFPGEAPNDGLPYPTLAYINGPEAGRPNLTGVDTHGDNYRFQGCIQMPFETHGGEDVPIYSKGPMSHLFHTTHEQHYIAHVMMYAACLGDYVKDESCDLDQRIRQQQAVDSPETCAASALPISSCLLSACVLLGAFLTQSYRSAVRL